MSLEYSIKQEPDSDSEVTQQPCTPTLTTPGTVRDQAVNTSMAMESTIKQEPDLELFGVPVKDEYEAPASPPDEYSTNQTTVKEEESTSSNGRKDKPDKEGIPKLDNSSSCKQNIKKQIRTNEKDIPKCDICNNTYSSLRALKRHIPVHIKGRRRHQCKMCSKSFSAKYTLIKHRKLHIVGRPECNVCHKTFSLERTLEEHLRVHTEGKSQCEICLKKFSYLNHLNIHMRTHAEGRPACEICQKTFATEQALKRHTLTHTEAPVVCKVCNKKFSREFTLQKHMRKHTEPAKCKYCLKMYTYKGMDALPIGLLQTETKCSH